MSKLWITLVYNCITRYLFDSYIMDNFVEKLCVGGFGFVRVSARCLPCICSVSVRLSARCVFGVCSVSVLCLFCAWGSRLVRCLFAGVLDGLAMVAWWLARWPGGLFGAWWLVRCLGRGGVRALCLFDGLSVRALCLFDGLRAGRSRYVERLWKRPGHAIKRDPQNLPDPVFYPAPPQEPWLEIYRTPKITRPRFLPSPQNLPDPGFYPDIPQIIDISPANQYSVHIFPLVGGPLLRQGVFFHILLLFCHM